MATRTSRLRLDRLIGVAALAAVFSFPMARVAIAAAAPAVPPGLQPALYSAMAKEAGPAYAIGRDGCATLKTQHLTACFGKGGARFRGQDAPPVSLQLAAYGRGSHLTSVKPAVPTIQGNRASYAHGAVTEWWRVLPVGFEQGFTVAKRPAGSGTVTLELAANHKAVSHGKAVAWGHLDYGKLVVTDAGGHVVPATLTHHGERIVIAVNDAQAVYPLTVDPLVWNQTQELTASDGSANYGFGFSVAVSGGTAIVGQISVVNDFEVGGGSAYVFTETDGTWSQTQKLTASDEEQGDWFGGAVAIQGSMAIIGADCAHVTGYICGPGAAYVFVESNGTWTQTQKLVASDGALGDEFGYSIALAGNEAVIGAPNASFNGGPGVGAAYVFTKYHGTWTQRTKLVAGSQNANFGRAVAIAADGKTIVIGAPTFNTVYVYTRGDNSPIQLTGTDSQEWDNFGRSVAIYGSTILVGAPSISRPGRAYVFTQSDGTWSQAQELTASDGNSGDEFGLSVALDGPVALIGAELAGHAYFFKRLGGVWSQAQEIGDGQGDIGYGFAVQLDGATALIATPWATVGGNAQEGAVYVYGGTCPQGYSEYDGTLAAGGIYQAPSYQAPAGLENAILGAPGPFQLSVKYTALNGRVFLRPIPDHEIHIQAPAGTYQWNAQAGDTGGDYVLCILHP